MMTLVGISTLGCVKTRVVSIKPVPCTVAAWPEFPPVRLLKDCPEGVKCIRDVDHMAIVFYLDQIERLRESFGACPEVHFTGSAAPTRDHVSP